MTTPADVLTFWFDELEFKQWWNTYPEVDATILERFGATHEAATKGELFSWRETPEGRLADGATQHQTQHQRERSTAGDDVAWVMTRNG